MLKAFEKIRHFGVFNAYARPKDIEDFSELNLIYGWNYSGKTTLSRVLRTIEKKSLHPDYSKAEFEISTDGALQSQSLLFRRQLKKLGFSIRTS